MATAPFVPKPSRGRIPISDADRAAARAGMDGEKTKQASEAAAVLTQPVAAVATEPAAPAAALTEPAAPVAAELVAPVVTAPEPAAAPAVATAPATPVPVATESTSEPAPAPVAATATAAPTVATAAAFSKPTPQPTATTAPTRRGRKPSVAPGAEPPAVRSVKIRETTWEDIRLLVAQLPKGENMPRNIQAYLQAAHEHYEASLRKQGKLPAK